VPLEQACKRAGAAVTDFTSKTAKGAFGDLIKPILGVTAAVSSVGAVMAGVKSSLDLGAELQNLSNRTGIAVDSLFMLQKAFKVSGVSAEALPGAIAKMQRSLAGLGVMSTGKAGDILKGLGLDPQQLASAKPEEAFYKIGNAINQLPNSTERAAAAMGIFGKSGAELLAVFSSPQFQNALKPSAMAKLLEQNAASFKVASETLSMIPGKVNGIFTGLAAGFIPMLNPLFEKIQKIDLSGIGKSIGDALGFFITSFTSGGISDLISNSFMIGVKEAVNFLSTGFFAVFQSIPDYLAAIGRQFVAYFELLTNSQFWSGLKDSLLSAAYAFKGTILLAVANILTTLQDYLPDWLAKKVGNGAAMTQGASDAAFVESAKYSDSAANGGMYSVLNKLEQDSKANVQTLTSAFLQNFQGNGKILGDTQKERSDLQATVDRIKANRDAANAQGREDADKLYKKDLTQGTFNPEDLGIAGKFGIIADSLAKVGGGGIALAPTNNPILEENKRQTSLLQSINQSILKGWKNDAADGAIFTAA
jgi:hypothetical protein